MKKTLLTLVFLAVIVAIGAGVWALSERISNGVKQEIALSPEVQQAIQSYIDASAAQPNLGTTQPIAGQTFNLAGSGVSNSATSITLASFTVTQTGQKIRDTDLSDTFYITLEPGNPAKQEIVSCTTVVQNANNSATLSGCTRGLSPITPYTASSTLRFSHGGGTQIIFSNPPQFYNNFLILDNNATVTGTITFSDSPLLTTDCTALSANNEICAKAYIDGVAIAGASNANETTKGIVEAGTQIEMASSSVLGSTGASLYVQTRYSTSSPYTTGLWNVITQNDGKISPNFIATSSSYTYNWGALHLFGGGFIATASSTFSSLVNFTATTSVATSTQPTGFKGIFSLVSGMTITPAGVPQAVTLATSSGRVYLVDGNVSTTTDFYGFALTSAVAGGAIQVQTTGVVTGFSGLTPGSRYYVQDTGTGGTIGTSVGTAEVYVGIAISATEIALDPNGSANSWQYLGSQSLTCAGATSVNQPLARFAVLAVYGTQSTPQSSGSDLIISKVGRTSATFSDGVVSSPDVIISVSWSGAVITTTLSEGSTCSVTASYYR